ncbi:MAG: helix-turn-helix domain-containing protein [Oscillospiraceae bacterium]|nr:helix-turn-helix domain-containing protein [Oscillospiraceae bacterium]
MIFERIRDLREDNDLKQTQLADYLCVKQATYSEYESGKINLPIEALIKLADFYETSTDYILGRTNEIKPYKRK